MKEYLSENKGYPCRTKEKCKNSPFIHCCTGCKEMDQWREEQRKKYNWKIGIPDKEGYYRTIDRYSVIRITYWNNEHLYWEENYSNKYCIMAYDPDSYDKFNDLE